MRQLDQGQQEEGQEELEPLEDGGRKEGGHPLDCTGLPRAASACHQT